jgi:PAS domain S-box-containing protein
MHTPANLADGTPHAAWRSYGAIFDAVLEAVLVADDFGHCVDANRAASILFGYTVEEMTGKHLSDFRAEPDPLGSAARWATLLERGELGGEAEIRRKDGTIRTIEHRSVANFVPGAHLISIRDITAAKLADRKRQQSEEELRASREQLRQLAGRLRRRVERERIGVSRALHEQLGQTLTALQMNLACLCETVGTTTPAARMLQQTFAAMRETVQGAVEQIRNISTDLRPTVLDRLGLLDAIEWQAEEFERRTGVRCRFHRGVETLELDSLRSTEAFRILQEALSNVTRHANASRVTVDVSVRGGHALLTIHDNGRGISDADLADPGALGLAAMRERALLAGGQLTIDRAGRGTLVILSIPVESSGAPQGERS